MIDGIRAPGPEYLWEKARRSWGRVSYVACDRFHLEDLLDVVPASVTVEPRIARWSDATFDIRALRRGAKDGPLSLDPPSRLLVAVSLSAAMVKNDDQGSVRMVDAGHNNTARDDVAGRVLSRGRGIRPATFGPGGRAAGADLSAHHQRPEWQRIRRLVLARDSWRCTACGRPGGLEAHHIQPVEKGGTDALDNLATLCRSCHLGAHGRRSVAARKDRQRKDWQRLIAALN